MNFFEPVELTTDPIIASQFTPQPILPQTNKQADRIGLSFEWLLLIFFLMSYIVGAYRYRKHRQQKDLTRSQNIQMLERMWMISSNR
ncbi:MAG: hypothetical protein ACRC2R_04400 [Xenococcaceae cyanobacterium]